MVSGRISMFMGSLLHVFLGVIFPPEASSALATATSNLCQLSPVRLQYYAWALFPIIDLENL